MAKPQSAALPGPRLALPGTFQHLLAGLVDTAGMGTAAVLGLRAALAVIGVRPSVQAVVDAFHKDAGQLLPILVVVPVVMSLWPLLAVILKATPGQRLAGLTLATTSGKPLTAGRLALRGLCSGLFAWLFLAGPAWSLLVDRRRRGLSDMVAGTVAVKR